MPQLTRTKKSRKKQSRFQKLWGRAEKLKQENELFRNQLDKLVQRMNDVILPVERAAAIEHIPLLKRLLTLGMRKSLSQWQRHELNDWVIELMEPLKASGQIDSKLEDDICRFNAFNIGIQLDEDSDVPLMEQMNTYAEQWQEEVEDPFTFETPEQQRARIAGEVEKVLDSALGPAPQQSTEGVPTFDLFQNELDEAEHRVFDEYQQLRTEMRERLISERIADESFAEDDLDFGFFDDDNRDNFDNSFADSDKTALALNSEVFTRLFRATVAVLHPDREPDEAKRELNHQLMTDLLKARKHGDVMTVLTLYQEHVDDDTSLSGKEEKQLISVLEQQLLELKMEQEEYSFSSPLHRTAYEHFYFKSAKKTENAFQEHITYTKATGRQAKELASNIKSLKALKPHLQSRYQEYSLNLESIFSVK